MAKRSWIGVFGALWGLAGVFLLIGSAIYRLAPLALETFSYDLAWYHWAALALSVLFMAYSEGYRGFQQGFSPRVAARARYLKTHPNVWRVLLGPFFCMGYFHATRKRKIVSMSLTAGIVILILAVRAIDQPWRGIIDAGVVVGLGWGLISLLIFSLLAFFSAACPYTPEVPEE